MKKYISITAICFAISFILIGCSDENDTSDENPNNDNTSEDNNVGSNETNSEKPDEQEKNPNNNVSSDPDGTQEITEEDQENLNMGDTGMVETTLGSYEVTLDNAELVGPELDGQETYDDDLILLDITIKNTGDESIDLEDIVSLMMVTDDLEGGGSFDGAEDFTSIEKFVGNLKTGDEKSGQLITDVVNADDYYLMQDPGAVAGDASNQVIWKFEPED